MFLQSMSKQIGNKLILGQIIDNLHKCRFFKINANVSINVNYLLEYYEKYCNENYRFSYITTQNQFEFDDDILKLFLNSHKFSVEF